MSCRLIKLLLATMLLLVAKTALTQERMITIATPEIKPYAYLDNNRQNQGLFVDYFEKVSEHEALKFNIIIMPWARAIEEVKQGRIDALLPTLYNKEREHFLIYPNQPFALLSQDVLIKRKDDPFTLDNTPNDTSQRILAKVRSMAVNKSFAKLAARPNIATFETKDISSALKMLKQRRIDLFITDRKIAENTINDLNMTSSLTILTLPGDKAPSYLTFSKAFASRHDVNQIMTQILSAQ